MTKPKRYAALAALAGTLSLLPGGAVAEKLPLTLDSIFNGTEFSNTLPRDTRWLSNGAAYTWIDPADGTLKARQVGENGNTLTLATPESLTGAAAAPQQVQWTPGLDYALVMSRAHNTWDGFRQGRYAIYSAADGKVTPLANGTDSIREAHLSPDGRHVAYVLDNNLFVYTLATGKLTQITRDGSESVFNGVFDYGSSEFGPRRAWHWSPDSQKIAFWRLDASEVPLFPLLDELQPYSQVRTFHYPNTGEVHAVNRIGVYSLDSGNTRWLNTGIDPDDYLPTPDWGNRGQTLFVQHLTRDHKQLRLLRFRLDRQGYDVPVEDSDPAWIDISDDFTSLDGGSDFLWTSERSGYRHIYRYREGKLSPLTGGDWSVDAIAGVSPAEGSVYFYAKKDSLVDQLVYRVPLSGGEPVRVSTREGWHQWQIAPGGRHALALQSDANTPPSLSLRSLPDGPDALIAANDVPGMAKYAVSRTEFVQFDTDDGITLNGFFIKPPDFDPGRRYPVIAYAYGNAGSQVVVNRWGTQRGPTQDLWHRYMAQQGYVIFAMDNRTTTGRGKAAKNLTYGHYGKYAVLDELQGVAYLRSLPWIDASRIGFWGWSGGGYLAAALMTKGAPHFKVGVSVAPVIDLTRYQAVGVERWMGTPEENPDGYAAVNLMNYADQLEGKLLLIHGTGDENVKYAFTLQFVDALIAANRQFDMVVYPNQRHTIADARLHVFSTITRYFEEHL